MGYKKNDACLDKAYDDEKIFVLMTRDSTSPLVVGEWIKQNIGIQPREKLIEALDCAIEMSERMGEINQRKILEKEGWVFCQRKSPPENSECEVLFSDGNTGTVCYWDGWDDFKSPNNIDVMAWKNPRRVG
ncbi:MAG: hypothetical protein AABY22_29980 [Nanoarchaeota archaeon]